MDGSTPAAAPRPAGGLGLQLDGGRRSSTQLAAAAPAPAPRPRPRPRRPSPAALSRCVLKVGPVPRANPSPIPSGLLLRRTSFAAPRYLLSSPQACLLLLLACCPCFAATVAWPGLHDRRDPPLIRALPTRELQHDRQTLQRRNPLTHDPLLSPAAVHRFLPGPPPLSSLRPSLLDPFTRLARTLAPSSHSHPPKRETTSSLLPHATSAPKPAPTTPHHTPCICRPDRIAYSSI